MTGSPMSGEDPVGALPRLLGVQQVDTAIAQQEHRKSALAERAALAAVEREAALLRRRRREVDGERQALLDRQTELENQTASITQRRRALEERLYGARGVAGRELAQMESEITQLNRRRAEIEESELSLLVDQEPLDAEIDDADKRLGDLDTDTAALRLAVGAADVEIDAELARLRRLRNEAVAGIPADLVERYEALRARLGGVGAARLVGNQCGGCHLELSSVEVDHIRHMPPDEVVTCDQCGRILVREAAVPPPT
jgi:predicted  nucleic acid-binding Zn-ribbon protein